MYRRAWLAVLAVTAASPATAQIRLGPRALDHAQVRSAASPKGEISCAVHTRGTT